MFEAAACEILRREPVWSSRPVGRMGSRSTGAPRKAVHAPPRADRPRPAAAAAAPSISNHGARTSAPRQPRESASRDTTSPACSSV
eukprot:2901044-Prymnesium_polylepis.2